MRWLAVAGVALGLAWPPLAAADPVRAESALEVLVRALAFDRALSSRAGDPRVVVEVYDSRVPRSAQARSDHEAIHERGGARTIGGVPVRFIAVDLAERSPSDVFAYGPDAVLLLPGVEPVTDALIAQTRARGVASLGLGAGYVDHGVAIAVDVTGAGPPRLIVDLRAAREEGMDLSSRLLRVAEVRR